MAHAVGVNRSAGARGSFPILGFARLFCFRFLIMALFAPFIVIEAALAELAGTRRASLQAAIAVPVIAAIAARDTLAAIVVVTAVAAQATVVTQGLAAFFTAPTIVVRDIGTTVNAVDSRPIRQGDVGTAGVVVAQQRGNDQEEAQQPALLQRMSNWDFAIPFTKGFVLHMGMGYVFIGRRRMGVYGHYLITVARTVLPCIPGKFDSKGTEIDPF